MKLLDQKEIIENADRQNMFKLIAEFSGQLKHAEEIGKSVSLNPNYAKGVTKIVFSGLGGSAIGADFIRSYLAYDLMVPIFVNRHYRLPKFVDEKTLLIVSSYSGETEETLSAFKQGLGTGAKIMAITSGGELARQALANSFPVIEIPGGMSPRAALGYSVLPLLVVLSKLGFKEAYRPQEFKEAQELIQKLSNSEYGTNVPFEKNKAKQLAFSCLNHFPIIYSGPDYLDVVALRWRGQIEENSKALAFHHVFPEMNHNELVGWKNPADLLKKTVVFILRDSADHKRIQMRMDLTRKIVGQYAHSVTELLTQGKGFLSRMLSLVHLGDWISVYLAVLYQVDPTPVEVIQYLKSELAKEPM